MRNIIILTITYLAFTANSFAAFSSNNGSSSTKEDFSESQFGLGISAAKEFKIIRSIFTENDKDYLFNEVGVFANYYGDAIDYNYGANLSFGYGYDKFGVYVSGGYLITDFEYISSGVSKNYSEGSGFVGLGTSYKITDNLKAKLDFTSYSFNFNPSNSNTIQKTEADIKSTTLGLQFYF
ncbi:porin family protein [Flavobacteriaceae bacterium]|nr:porin family protein [Flavobacteriaceae bacterium]